MQASGARTSEVAWPGGGGGWVTEADSFNVLPPFQKGKGVPKNINFRLMPDVALHADGQLGGNPDAAYYFFYGGSLNVVAGTSCASPLFTGALGDVEQRLIQLGQLRANPAGKKRLGRLADLVYSENGRSDVWYDITSGSNGTLPNGQTSVATPFWDTCTGWGAINWQGFVNTFASALSTANPTSVSIYNGQGANATGGVPQLLVQDQQYYTQQAVVTSTGVMSAAQMTYTLNLNGGTLAALQLNVVANGSSFATNFIYLYNYTTNVYDIVGTNAMTGQDVALTIPVNNLTAYVGPNGAMKMIDRMVIPLRKGLIPYTMKLDLATVSYEVVAGGT